MKSEEANRLQSRATPIDNTLEENTLTWNACLKDEKQKNYYLEILNTIKQEQKKGITIYPPRELMFEAFKLCELNQVKVLILGQDPYHGPNQAEGLAFSVPSGSKTPPSLKNIIKELCQDIGHEPQVKDSLKPWANQGVFLLNSYLSVQAGKPLSHSKIGWERFTDQVISTLNHKLNNVVFLLWGGFARKKAKLINPQKHLILEAAHPSPLSAYRGFFGCKHFTKTNNYLQQHSLKAIKW